MRRPWTMTWAPVSLSGFSSTGFMWTVGSTPQARACSAWARPISPPSAVTAALFDMFCGLNGRTRSPRRVKARASPATISDLPTSEPVPWFIRARVMGRTLRGSAAPLRPATGRTATSPQGEGGVEGSGEDGGLSARGRERPSPSELDPLLRLHPGGEVVLDVAHLGDEVGGLDQGRLGVAAGDDHVEAGAAGVERP